jgi:membrane protein DedA with SNARE-associated domain
MGNWIIHAILSAGYLGIVVLMLVETIVPVIPSELVMASAGIAVAQGTMSLWPLVLASAAGATLGNLFWYTLGHRLGYERLKPLIERRGRWLTLEWPDVEQGTRFLRRHGHWVVCVMRVSPVGRTIISLPAGLVHIPRWKFLGFTFVGTAVWNGLWIAGGHWLAPHLAEIKPLIGWVVGGIFAFVLSVYAWRVTHWKPRA